MFEAQTGRSHRTEFTWQRSGYGARRTAMDAAQTLWELMQRAGLRYSELMGHCEDLAAGAWLTAEDGTAFRVVRV